MRHFSFRPTLTMKGRKFKGLRGLSGKPTHPPFTDIPIGAYVIAAALDIIAFIGSGTAWSKEYYQAATFVFVGGLVASLLAVVTGVADWWTSSEPGTQARRTINAHAITMVVATLVVVADLALRTLRYHALASPPPLILALSLVALVLITIGATYGGSMVFDYGFNVETAGDHPVWSKSETDVFPGHHGDAAATSDPAETSPLAAVPSDGAQAS
jgi:uncharacterized membrane protein